MEKKVNQYRRTLEQLILANGTHGGQAPLRLQFSNHEEICQTIERIKEKALLNDPPPGNRICHRIKTI
jgi:hypothetical protein